MKVLSLSLIAALALGTLSAFSTAPGGYELGDIVQDFSLVNVDETMTSLKDQAGEKGAIVIFTCNTCPYAVAYEQRIMDLDAKYRGMGYPVIAINPNDVKRKPGDSFEKMQSLAKNRGYTFPYLYDESQEVAKTFGATRTPHVYLLKRTSKNEMKLAFVGAIDDKPMDAENVEQTFLADAISNLEAGKKPDPASVKALGCTIKWAAEQ